MGSVMRIGRMSDRETFGICFGFFGGNEDLGGE